MKKTTTKTLLWAGGILIALIVAAPMFTGNLEQEALNEETRKRLDGSFIALSDGVTHYELKGGAEGDDGQPTIVLIHGNAVPYCAWDYTINALADAGFRVLRYDVFGHGFSDRPELPRYDRELYDRQLTELLDALDITEPVSLAGTSQGGSISIHFAARHPERVKKIALLAPLFDTFQGKQMVRLLRIPGIGEYMMGLMGDKSLTNPASGFASQEERPELVQKLRAQVHYKGKKRAVLANMRGNALDNATELYAEVKRLGIPVLLAHGRDDRAITAESISALREMMPDVEYHEFDKAGHLAQYEIPEQMNPVLINFFTQ